MPDLSSPIHTSPSPEILDPGLSVSEKLSELRKKNEAEREAEKAKGDLPDDSQTEAIDSRKETDFRETPASHPRALRAIASDGNVIATREWLWEREPTEPERAAFLASVPRASRVEMWEGEAKR